MAIGTALTFIWASDNSPMLGAYSQFMEQIQTGANQSLSKTGKILNPEEFDSTASAKYLVKWTNVFLPFGYFIGLAILAAIYHVWDEKVSYVVRLRYFFAIILPGSFLGFTFALSTLWVPDSIFLQVNNLGLLLMYGAYFYIAYRGAYANYPTVKRLLLSLAVTVLCLLVVMFATIAALIMAIIPTVRNTFPDVIDIPVGTAMHLQGFIV